MYHEYSYRGRLERRNYSGAASFDFGGYQTSPELEGLMAQLREKIGSSAYYTWASQLGMRILLDPPAYIRELEAKLEQVVADSELEQLSFLPPEIE